MNNKFHSDVANRAACNGRWPDGSDDDPDDPGYWKNTPGDVIDATAAAGRSPFTGEPLAAPP